MRSLASVQVIENILPISGADRIVVAEILGWNVVIPRESFVPGDKVVFFEVDTLLPATDDRYREFQQKQKSVWVDGKAVEGTVLKTLKIRGVLSQGLALSLPAIGVPADTPVGTDVTEIAGVHKWEFTDNNFDFKNKTIGFFDTRFAPKTDATRLQSLVKFWEEIKTYSWHPTLKIDGSSQTLVNDKGRLRYFSRNLELSTENSLVVKTAEKQGIVHYVMEEPGRAVQFEFAGPKIQGNRLRLSEQRVFVFSVYHHGVFVPRQFWGSLILEVNAAPLLDTKKYALRGTVQEMIDFVSENLIGNITDGVQDEGIVYHWTSATSPAPSWLGSNPNFKIINNKYLLKNEN